MQPKTLSGELEWNGFWLNFGGRFIDLGDSLDVEVE